MQEVLAGTKGTKGTKTGKDETRETWGDMEHRERDVLGDVLGDVLLYPLPTQSANGESLKNENRKRHCYSNRKMALEGDSKAPTCQHF